MPPDLQRQYFPNGAVNPVNTIGNLYFEPAYKIPNYDLSNLNLSTFGAYNYYLDEVKIMSSIIKRLFIKQPVWSYNDLWTSVRDPPIGIEMNPKLFSEHNFIIALNNLVESAPRIISTQHHDAMTEHDFVEKIFDHTERHVYIAGVCGKVEQLGEYYVWFPIAEIPDNPLNTQYAEYIEHVRDKERAMIKEFTGPANRVVVDVETYARSTGMNIGTFINIEHYLKRSHNDVNYINTRTVYLSKKSVQSLLWDFSIQFQIHFVEEAIQFAMSLKSAETQLEQTYISVLNMLSEFGATVKLREVCLYKDTAKQYKAGLPKVPDDTVVGYQSTKSVKLLDLDGKWIEISKVSLNRHAN
jgi:hypothetical protein